MDKLFERTGIKAPGRMNILLDGRFQTVALDDLQDDKLEQLYNNGCPYVKRTENFYKSLPKEEKIEMKDIKVKDKKPNKHR
jgi:hypothetical protein